MAEKEFEELSNRTLMLKAKMAAIYLVFLDIVTLS